MPSKDRYSSKPRKNMSRVPKKRLWLKHYLNENNPDTFLNATASVKAAGYKCNGEPSFNSLGYENIRYHEKAIGAWLDDNGLSENALKTKLLSLLSAKETKFFQNAGMVIEERIVEAIETQRKTLDMALKVKGMYAPARLEHTGRDGKKLKVEHSLDESWKELLDAVTTDNTDELPNT